MIYPWLQSSLERVSAQLKSDRLPHALLISGAPGLGKSRLALEIARLCLCMAPAGDSACGSCKACHLMTSGSHSDFRRLSPQEGKKQISIDDVRTMVEFAHGSSMQKGRKVIVIEPIESLNRSSANALLKTLEEPSKGSLLILVAQRQEAVLPTIRSRCQTVHVRTPNMSVAKEWLGREQAELSDDELSRYLSWSGGAPLRAKAFVAMDAAAMQSALLTGLSSVLKREQTVSSFAAECDDDMLAVRLEWLLQWSEQMILHASTGEENAYLFEDSVKMLSYLAMRSSREQLFGLREYLLQQLALLSGNTNPNSALLFESVLLQWFALMAKRAA